MFHSLFPFRRLLATSFLLVFVNVLAGQCYCASMRPVASAAAKPAPMAPGHACCRAAAAAKAKQAASKSTAASHEKRPVGADDCCRKKAASVVAGLDSPAAKLLVPAPAVLPTALAFHFRPVAGKWDRMGAVALVPPRQLKPKIPDIRIFIQSLTV
ncbi:hypothetical protein GCM10022409_47640 [Hymenobacter glaciei]|uniref:Uncharacterized protein n=1 Tax=Hymenobacter glaciei TaxID=877209 RepID=A0ABP7UXB2_9BACT